MGLSVCFVIANSIDGRCVLTNTVVTAGVHGGRRTRNKNVRSFTAAKF